MAPLFGFLINLLILALVFVIVRWVLGLVAGAVGLPANAIQIIMAILALIFLLYLIGGMAGYVPVMYPWRR